MKTHLFSYPEIIKRAAYLLDAKALAENTLQNKKREKTTKKKQGNKRSWEPTKISPSFVKHRAHRQKFQKNSDTNAGKNVIVRFGYRDPHIESQSKMAIWIKIGKRAAALRGCFKFHFTRLKVDTVRLIKCFSSESSWKPKTQPNDSRAAVWLSFWFSTRPSADTVTY